MVSDKIILLGHSYGATAIISGISINNKFFEEKVLTSILISPIININKNEEKNFIKFLEGLEVNELMGKNPKSKAFLFTDAQSSNFNNKLSNVFPLNRALEDLLNADNTKWTESPTTYAKFWSKFPGGTSRQFIEHIKQIHDSGCFKRFDPDYVYGKENSEGNILYSFEAFKDNPVILCLGKADKINFNFKENNSKFIASISNNSYTKILEFQNMGHYCFLLNNDLTWINFLLESLSEQVKKINYLNVDKSVTKSRKQVGKRSLIIGNKSVGGGTEYGIN